MQDRGKGFDRRPIIIIDGKNYRAGARETAELARRMTAKELARQWFWAMLDLAVMALFFGAFVVWAILERW